MLGFQQAPQLKRKGCTHLVSLQFLLRIWSGFFCPRASFVEVKGIWDLGSRVRQMHAHEWQTGLALYCNIRYLWIKVHLPCSAPAWLPSDGDAKGSQFVYMLFGLIVPRWDIPAINHVLEPDTWQVSLFHWERMEEEWRVTKEYGTWDLWICSRSQGKGKKLICSCFIVVKYTGHS